ncbi:MAG: hypothetical protein JO337_08315 [Acidimicrobiales bacterium]|nr:hypothetical protein [Acidimicrobiales bacterium]
MNPGHTRTLRGRAAVVGIGETEYLRHGQASEPEFVLALRAILTACRDAGIDPGRIDGFTSYSNDRNLPSRLASAIGVDELRYSSMVWGGGGGGVGGAVSNAAMAIATGMADCVVAFRALAQGQFGRFGQVRAGSVGVTDEAAFTLPYGLGSPAQQYAMRFQRWVHDHQGRGLAAQRAVALASYHHAQTNPRAVMNGRPLTGEAYDASRWIVEPWRLYDCCQENDGAAAMILVPAEAAPDMSDAPVFVLGAAQGSDGRFIAPVHNAPRYATANFSTVAPRMWAMAGIGPRDVDCVQSYENFTGGVVMSLVEHGFASAEEVDDMLAFERLIAPGGALPLNTSGGNLAEAYMHGFGLHNEAIRQLRGSSCNQIPGAKVVAVTGGPMVGYVSDVVYGSEDTL